MYGTHNHSPIMTISSPNTNIKEVKEKQGTSTKSAEVRAEREKVSCAEY